MAEPKNASTSRSSSLDYVELGRKVSATANKMSKEALEGIVKDFAYKGLDLKQIQEFILKTSKNSSEEVIMLILCGLLRGNNTEKMLDPRRSTKEFCSTFGPLFKKYDIQNNVTTAEPAKGNPIVTLSRVVAAFADISLTLLGKVSMPPAITNERYLLILGTKDNFHIPYFARGHQFCS